MSKPKILVIVGGISSGSINKQLSEEVKGLTSDKFEFDEIEIAAIPYYSQDDEENMPSVVKSFKAQIKACDGVLLITPEYNRSIPGVLKNAVDWGSRPYGSNSWMGKPAVIMGSTPGSSGTICAQNHLHQILAEIGVCIMPVPHFYHSASGPAWQIDDRTKQHIVKIMDAFAIWMEKINK